MKQIIFYICIGMLLTLAACEEDATVIEPVVLHGQSTMGEETNNSKGAFSSSTCSGTQIVQLYIGDPEKEGRDEDDLGSGDEIWFVLSKPAEKDITLKFAMEKAYAEPYNNGTYASNFARDFFNKYKMAVISSVSGVPLGDNLLINGEKEAIVTIKAGELQSEKVVLLFKRENLSSGARESYLFPIFATNVETNEIYGEIDYLIDPIEPLSMDNKPCVVISYVDTEVVNPLIAGQFILKLINLDMNTWEETTLCNSPMFDITNIRTAYLKEVQGRAILTYTSDIQYVLKNNKHYLQPMQQKGMKICLAIKGGGTGLGFANMSDEQIGDFVAQVQTAVKVYQLDGINLWDEGADYGKEGMPAVNSTSYAKLIKALKTAMPDKLLTLVDTRETTESLCDEQAGIRVGDYLDYAWSSMCDLLEPYGSTPDVRPLAGMPENKYGTYFFPDWTTFTEDEKRELNENSKLAPYFMGTATTSLSGMDVIVGGDIPYLDYGKEAVWGEIWEKAFLVKYPVDWENDTFQINVRVESSNAISEYYSFKKDW